MINNQTREDLIAKIDCVINNVENEISNKTLLERVTWKTPLSVLLPIFTLAIDIMLYKTLSQTQYLLDQPDAAAMGFLSVIGLNGASFIPFFKSMEFANRPLSNLTTSKDKINSLLVTLREMNFKSAIDVNENTSIYTFLNLLGGVKSVLLCEIVNENNEIKIESDRLNLLRNDLQKLSLFQSQPKVIEEIISDKHLRSPELCTSFSQ